MKRWRSVAGATAACLTWAVVPVSAAAPQVHAITDVRIVVAPGQTIENGTVVVRDGVIAAVGSDVAVPEDARVWERSDLTVYPGLIEPYATRSWPDKAASDDEPSPGAHGNEMVRPERSMATYGIEESQAKRLREAGFTTAVVAPKEGIFRGRSAVMNLGAGKANANLLIPDFAHNLSFATNSFGEGYPVSLMGAIALIRQTIMDTRWHGEAWRAYEANPAQKRPQRNAAWAALAGVAAGSETLVVDTEEPLNALRAGRLAREFGLDVQLVGSGKEYRWLDEIVALDTPILLPLSFPDVPNVPADGEPDDPSLSLEDLRHWDEAPTNPKALLDAGATIAFTSHGLDDPKTVLTKAYLAIDRGGLTADEALAALTVTPAALLGISGTAGTVEVGKMANLLIAEGDLFVEEPSLREVWVDGERFEIKEAKPPEIEPAGIWDLTVLTPDGQKLPATLTIEGTVPDLSGTISSPSGDVDLDSASVSGKRLEISFNGASYGMPGTIELHLEIEGNSGTGSGTIPDGSNFSVKGTRTPKEPEVSS